MADTKAGVPTESRPTNEEVAERITGKIQSLLAGKYTNSFKIACGIIRQELDAASSSLLPVRPIFCTRGPHQLQKVCPDAFGVPCSPPEGLPVGRQLECGENSVLDANLVGCGKPLNYSETFRCVDCGVPFHRECAGKHFIAGESVLTEAIANEQFRRDDVREGLRIVVSARDYLNEQTPKDWTATELLNGLWGKFMKEQSSWKTLAGLPVGESTREK